MSARITRLEFAELAPNVQTVLEARVKRLGYLGEFFKCAGHQPDVLAPFMEMTEALKKALPDNLTELGALTGASVMANAYERNQHERLSRKLGFSDDWIRAVEALVPNETSALSEDERAVQAFLIAVIENRGKAVSALLETVIDRVGPDQAIALLFLVGRYVTHAFIVNALGLAPPVPSVFEEEAAS